MHLYHKRILKYLNCRLVLFSELCVVKLHDEFFPLLDLLAMVLNPANKFHCYNASRPSEFKLPPPPKNSQSDSDSMSVNNRNRNEDPERSGRNDDDEDEPYACINDGPYPKGRPCLLDTFLKSFLNP